MGVGSVRVAVSADAPALGDVHVACWRQAYAHLFSPAFLAALDVDQRREQWARRLADRGPGRALVAVVDERIVGFAWTGPGRDEPPVREVELTGLYLLAAQHGTGLGQALLAAQHGTGLGQALLDAALGDRPASLWTAEDNPRAIAFHARNGFTPDGARKVEPSWEDLVEVRLTR